MATIASRITDIQTALDRLTRQHRVPGATLGILHGDELVEFVTGIVNRNTGIAVTPTTLFQIGSNTKVYTAVLAMQLVDEGVIDLDTPVRKYLPDLKLGDPKALSVITPRMLLTHVSGLEGDHFEDTGADEASLGRYVEGLATLGQIHKPGEMWSYCNSGVNLLGYMVERLRGMPFNQVLKEKLFAPLRLIYTTVLMEEMLAHSCAVGHVLPPSAPMPVVPPKVMMSPAHMPAGSMTASTSLEVLRFAQMHLAGGRARDGSVVLSPESVKLMQQPQVKMPVIGLGNQMGLGWMLDEWDGERVLSHGGNTIGTASYLKVLPDRGFAVTLLTNSVTGLFLWRDLARFLFYELVGVHAWEQPKLPDEPPKVDLRKYEGVYKRAGLQYDFKAADDHLDVTISVSIDVGEKPPPAKTTARPIDAETFLNNNAGNEGVMVFMDFDRSGRPRYMHTGARVNKRVAEAPTAPKRKKKVAPRKGEAKRRPTARRRSRSRR